MYEHEDLYWIYSPSETEGDDYWHFVELSEIPYSMCGKAIWKVTDGDKPSVILGN